MARDPKLPWILVPLGLLAGIAVFVCVSLVVYRPDRPVATIGSVDPRRLELGADGWNLVLVLDADGRVTPESQIVFELMFEERLRKVHCRPGDPVIGVLGTTMMAESGELSGSFDIELAHCEDSDTGSPLGWPPESFLLRGSFDRLPLDAGVMRR